MKKVFVFHTRAGLEAVLGEQGDKTAAGRETLEGEALLNKGSHFFMIQGDRSVFNMTVKAHDNWSVGALEYWVRNKEPADSVIYLFQSSITPLLHYSKNQRNLVGL